MENDFLIPISALQHFHFCPRQCALIYIDQLWSENVYTAEGSEIHKRAHSGKSESRRSCKILTDVELYSEKYGIYGKSDILELYKVSKDWIPYPVEYKRGRPKTLSSNKFENIH